MSTNRSHYLLFSLLVILHLSFSCSSRKKDFVEAKQDSTKQNIQSVTNQDYKNLDTLSQLIKYFSNKNATIPIDVCGHYIRIDDFEQLYSGCYSWEMFEYENLKLFIIRLKCMAGGICEEERLLIFDKNKFKSQFALGLVISDGSFKKQVEYKFLRDNLIQLNIVNQEFDNNGSLESDTSYQEYYSIANDGLIKKIDSPN